MEIDMRIIRAAQIRFKDFLRYKNGGYFFSEISCKLLFWSYTIMRKHNKISSAADVTGDQDYRKEMDSHTYYKELPEVYKLAIIVMLAKFAEVQDNGEPFVICEYNAADDYEAAVPINQRIRFPVWGT